MIRGDQGLPKADGRFQAVRGGEVPWRNLGKITGAPTHPLGRARFIRRPLVTLLWEGGVKKILLVGKFGGMWL